jgi:hypothetical protein
VNHIDQIHPLNEVDHFVQTGVDMSAIIAYCTDTDLRPLPKIIISDLRDGHIKLVPHPIDHLPDHMPFPFQRMILWNPKIELTNSNDHRSPPSEIFLLLA